MLLRLPQILLVFILFSLPLRAEDLRFISGNAIINAPYQILKDNIISSNELNRLNNNSFNSLIKEKISNIALNVSIRRKIQNNGIKKSERFLKSRNPCNAPVIKRLLRVAKTLSCEPNWEVKLTITPNDTMYSNVYSASQSSAGRIHLPEAWDLTTGSSNVLVGIIDTGIDYNHLDLQANIWTNPGEIAGNSIDDDGDGYTDDLHGIDRINSDSDPFDDQSHGTHVAGTIGAVGNNSRGVVGISWNVKMIACKAFNSSGVGTVTAIVGCLNYLTTLRNSFGVNIVATSNSYGGFPYTVAMYNAIAASRDAGIVYVAGAGNNTSDNDITPFYPASYNLDNIISVGATDSSANIASFSNYGATSVDISAPGVSILSTIPSNQYAYYNGTSMATPHVTGAVALLMSYHPSYVYSQVISSIISTGTSISGLSGKSITGAILNVDSALQYAAPPPPPINTATPIPTSTPTSLPTETPVDEDPDLSTAKLDIASSNTRIKSTVSCILSASSKNDSHALPNYEVSLLIKGIKTVRKAISNEDGNVIFTVKPPKRKTYSARCSANVTNPVNSEIKIVKSRTVALRLK